MLSVTMEEDYEIVQRAAELIRDPEHWTANTAARDAHGMTIECDSPHAVRFCAFGALRKVAGSSQTAGRLINDINRTLKVELVYVNDHYGRNAALTIFDSYLALNAPRIEMRVSL